MAAISDVLVSDVHAAFPDHPCLVSTVRTDDYPRVSPRGSVQAFDTTTFALWDRRVRGAVPWHGALIGPFCAASLAFKARAVAG